MNPDNRETAVNNRESAAGWASSSAFSKISKLFDAFLYTLTYCRKGFLLRFGSYFCKFAHIFKCFFKASNGKLFAVFDGVLALCICDRLSHRFLENLGLPANEGLPSFQDRPICLGQCFDILPLVINKSGKINTGKLVVLQ